jgi:hypothetical protein
MAQINFNPTVLTGNLTRDPELRSTRGATPVCSLRIATSNVDVVIAADELARSTRVRARSSSLAGVVLGHRGAEGALPARRNVGRPGKAPRLTRSRLEEAGRAGRH